MPQRYQLHPTAIALIASGATGLAWHVLAYLLMSGWSLEGLHHWAVAGIFAGVCAGYHTLWSRKRNEGRETVVAVATTYYLGIFAYWLAFLCLGRVALFVKTGGWSSFNLRDNLVLLPTMLALGTFLIFPLALFCFINRELVWFIYRQRSIKIENR